MQRTDNQLSTSKLNTMFVTKLHCCLDHYLVPVMEHLAVQFSAVHPISCQHRVYSVPGIRSTCHTLHAQLSPHSLLHCCLRHADWLHLSMGLCYTEGIIWYNTIKRGTGVTAECMCSTTNSQANNEVQTARLCCILASTRTISYISELQKLIIGGDYGNNTLLLMQ